MRDNLEDSQSPLNTYTDRYSMIMDDDNLECEEIQISQRHDSTRSRRETEKK